MRRLVTFFTLILLTSTFCLVGGLVSSPQQSFKVPFRDFAVNVNLQGKRLTVASPASAKGTIRVIVSGREVGRVSSGLELTSLVEYPEQNSEIVLDYSRPAAVSDVLGLAGKRKLLDALEAGVSLVYSEIQVAPLESASIGQDVAMAATLPNRTFIRYQTFIPTEFTPAPPLACTFKSWVADEIFFITGDLATLFLYDFGGNNRSWDPDAIENSKTSFSVGVNWPLNGQLTTSKTVGQTDLYLRFSPTSHLLVASDRALSTGMVMTPYSANSSSVVFEMQQDVTNPLCISGPTLGISFDYHFTIFRSGYYSINGVSIAVPNHELYVRDSDFVSWQPVMRRTLNSFNCLSLLNALTDPNYDVACRDSGTYVGTR